MKYWTCIREAEAHLNSRAKNIRPLNLQINKPIPEYFKKHKIRTTSISRENNNLPDAFLSTLGRSYFQEAEKCDPSFHHSSQSGTYF